MVLNALITSKTRLRLLINFFINQADSGCLNGLVTEFKESTNSITNSFQEEFKKYNRN